jgi:hypothetical protein
MKKNNKWFWIFIPALILAGCGSNNSNNSVSTPEGGTGAVASNSAVAGVTFVNSLLSGVTTAAKPSAGGLNAGIMASAFTFPTSIPCSDGGSIGFSGFPVTGFSVDNCVQNGVTISSPTTTIKVIPGVLSLVGCGSKTLPTDFDFTLNGAVKIGAVDFSLTDFELTFTNIIYDDSCKPASFDVTVKGKIVDNGISTTVDYGTTGVTFHVVNNSASSQIEISILSSGTITVQTPCLNGSFTMATTSTIIIPSGATCPTSGSVTISGGLSGVVNYPDDCTTQVCALIP